MSARRVRASDVSAEQWIEYARQKTNLFWASVDKTEACWLWHYRAHRLAWELEHGPMPVDAVAMHSCDTPACVRPEHVAPATQAGNRADCMQKGRAAKGHLHGRASIDEAKVRLIREAHAGGLNRTQIAARVSASVGVVDDVLSGRTWRHVA